MITSAELINAARDRYAQLETKPSWPDWYKGFLAGYSFFYCYTKNNGDTSALEDTLNRFMDFCSKIDDVWAEEFRKWIEDYVESISKTQAAHTSS